MGGDSANSVSKAENAIYKADLTGDVALLQLADLSFANQAMIWLHGGQS
jgi:hypothetical protein